MLDDERSNIQELITGNFPTYMRHYTQAQLSRPVLVCGTPVDLCRLYREVQRRGGFEEVGSREQW
jgi:hypothetical protein